MYKKRAKQFLCFLLSLCLAGTVAFGDIGELPGLNVIAYANEEGDDSSSGTDGNESGSDSAGDQHDPQPGDPDYVVDPSLCEHLWELNDSGDCYACSYCTMTVSKGEYQFCEIRGFHRYDSGGDCEDCHYYNANEDVLPRYTVTFMDGDTKLSEATVKSGKCVEKPADPTSTTGTFTGWYLENAETAFDFANTPITADTTLYAHFDKLTAITYLDPTSETGTTTVEPGNYTIITSDTTSWSGTMVVPEDTSVTINGQVDLTAVAED